MKKTLSKNTKLHVKKGDKVKVIASNSKNKTGEIITILPSKQKAIVKGLNLVTHYLKASQKNPKGGIEKKEAPIHISNLMIIDEETKQPTRTGRKLNKNNKLQRYSKKTSKFI